MKILGALAGCLLSLAVAAPAHADGVTVGAQAPDFTLSDTEGKAVKLSDQKGKTVVLEWFNPGCPYVKASHTKGSLVGTAKRITDKGVVWLAINSGAPGKEGSGLDRNRDARKAFGLDHPVLLDEAGTVGKAYGATNTPHCFVIGKDGKLAYQGAIDNGKFGKNGDKNYVKQAVEQLLKGETVTEPETKAYGCSVKYKS